MNQGFLLHVPSLVSPTIAASY